jgi:hypothetical protein
MSERGALEYAYWYASMRDSTHICTIVETYRIFMPRALPFVVVVVLFVAFR